MARSRYLEKSLPSRIKLANGISAQLRRSSRRRSIGIKVQHGEVRVSAPTASTLHEIEQFVQQKAAWIARHLERQQHLLANQAQLSYAAGETIYIKGREYTIALAADAVTHIKAPHFILAVQADDHAGAARAVAAWFTDLAVSDLPARVAHWAGVMALGVPQIKIRHYKSRWGSCNQRGELQFNWLLMMAPEPVIDYVVVHELAHLVHFNHSPAFWRLVHSVLPHYRDCRVWLREQTHLVWHQAS